MSTWRPMLAAWSLALALVACGDDQDTGQVTSTTASPSTTTLPTSTTEAPGPDEVEAEGVLLSAILLIAGDIEAAVAAGLVAPAEVDAAAEALETAKLAQWVTAATQALGG